ncbi:Tre2p [Saccharomyces cerevisiae x Saccharomyces kudriavzevii VIN7]|uniref:Tre2p n=1 Tax=Saccharomyces cerevisiae x Saccharomyces kudriavzevii (strain VIN7) TaxID=1095631 RepID=H0H1F1_SACCK|nr:Tre2p [Saccharomyces cerevisiae x Saccharomyces kudriavzevii VIN7]
MSSNYQPLANTDLGHENTTPAASSSHTLLMNQHSNDSPVNFDNVTDTNITPPPEPPSYEFDIEDPHSDLHKISHLQRVSIGFQEKILEPLMENIIHPFFQILRFIQDKADYYLSKIGNPFILRRFFYIILMSFVAYYVLSSGYLLNEKASGSRGMFFQHDILFQYAKKSVDLAKFERDLEYISSMPHASGTKGDAAIARYIQDSFNNNGLKLVKEMEYPVYSNYPGNVSISYYDNKNEKHDLKLSTENFNPLSSNGELSRVSLIYGGKGTTKDLQNLKDSNTIEDGKDYVLLLKYDKIVSQQVLIAEKFGAKAVIFISEPYGKNIDVVQPKPVGLPQYSTGDALSPSWLSSVEDQKNAKYWRLAHIPTVPISSRQGQELLSHLFSGDITGDGDKNYDNNNENVADVLVDLLLQTDVRERHSVSDIVGKIEGREQSDKAIIIAASRNSINFGTSYPDFGTSALLSILQLFQELKYKFDWKPLRNIYFISFGGSELNYAGSSGLIQQRLMPLKDEIYSLIDISQLGIPLDTDDENGKTRGKLNIETHPLLKKFFKSKDGHPNFDVSVESVRHYGDWTPFLANGIPVSVISSDSARNRFPPIETSEDTFEHFRDTLEDERNQQAVSDLLIFLLHISTKLVDDPLLPFDIINYVEDIDERLQKLEQEYSGKLNFISVINGLLFWKKIGNEWASWTQGWENIVWSHGDGIEPSLLSIHRWTWNKKLTNIGRRTCSPAGLPNRTFYKNVLFGPTLMQEGSSNNDEGVDFWTFPGVKDAIYDNDWNRAQEQVDLVGNILHQSAALFVEETTDIGYK